MSVLLLSADLMTGSKVSAAANQAGVPLITGFSAAALSAKAEAASARLIMVDLASIKGPLLPLVEALRPLLAAGGQLLAFGPHVHEARLEEAAAAGFDVVLARGQFHAQLDRILAATTPQS